MYLSDRAASDENNEYFNKIFIDYDRVVIDDAKRIICEHFEKKDALLHSEDEEKARQSREAMRMTLTSCGTVLEVGFGGGDLLVSLLRSGVAAFGVDLSVEAVVRFRRKYPEFSECVGETIPPERRFDGAYSSALFEHLDDPHAFLGQMNAALKPGGCLIIDNIPVTDGLRATIDVEKDIGFWKPCHRAIYSTRGLRGLFRRTGFRTDNLTVIDSFNYRLLSTILAHGYEEIVQIRDPRVKSDKLPGRLQTYWYCREAMKASSVSKLGFMTLTKLEGSTERKSFAKAVAVHLGAVTLPPAARLKKMARTALRLAASRAESIRRDKALITIRGLIKGRVGKLSSQRLFEELHRLSLAGMNIGGGADFRSSGEEAALEYVRDHLALPGRAVLFDIGANVGHYSLMLKRVFGRDAIIHAFEPSRLTYEKLLANVGGEASIQAHNFGVSDHPSEQLLYTDAEASGLASVYKRKLDHFDIHMDQSETVKFDTIDVFCTEHGVRHINFLKLDVEGHELKVLKGAIAMIEAGNIDYIQFEFGGCNIDSRTYFQDFFYLLKDKYRLFRIVKDGLQPIDRYAESQEVFITTNFLAERRP